MSSKETNIRSVLFLVIGILLLLSLVICIYIVSSESDLVETEALVKNVKEDADGSGKNDVTVEYEVDGVPYRYNFYYNKEVSEGDTVNIYYHEKNNTSVTTFKTSKLIFICPLVGLVLCIMGLFELFKKTDDVSEDFKTSVVGVVGNTQQLKIVTNDEVVQEYVKTPEEEVEMQVKSIKKDLEAPSWNEESTALENEESTTLSSVSDLQLVPEIKIIRSEEKDLDNEEKSLSSASVPKATISSLASVPSTLAKELESGTVEDDLPKAKEETIKEDIVKIEDSEKEEPEVEESEKDEIDVTDSNIEEVEVKDTNDSNKEEVKESKNAKDDSKESKEEINDLSIKTETKEEEKVVEKKEALPELPSEKVKNDGSKESVSKDDSKDKGNSLKDNKENALETKEDDIEEDMVEKVKDSLKNGDASIEDEEIKKVIKNVLKEVIQEVQEEKEPEKKIEQKRVLPNYYYISGSSLIYEEPGKESKELNLKTIKSIVRTVNSAGRVVKLVVSSDEIKCILTNMKNIDLEQVANLLQSKMHAIDDKFKEVVEHKEY